MPSLVEVGYNLDLGHVGQRTACGQGHEAEFVAYRVKTFSSTMGAVELNRAYYHCSACAKGVVPKDRKLGLIDFENNKARMAYGEYTDAGLFVGSGVVEAGCKTVVAHRCKQSGMFWTLRGVDAVIVLRCLFLSGRWEELWGWRYRQMQAA